MITHAPRRQFLRSEHGNVGMTFGLMMAPMLMLLGGAVDLGRALHAQNEMQAAVDAGALAAASSTKVDQQERQTIAMNMFDANTSATSIAQLVRQVSFGEATVTLSASGEISTNFLSVTGVDKLSLRASATAKSSYDPSLSNDDLGKVCMLGLDPGSTDGIHLQGDNDISYLRCWGYTNSTLATAINAAGNTATAVGEGHCAVGGFVADHDNFLPVPRTACVTAPDPFATVGAYSGGTYAPNFTPPAVPATCVAHALNLKKGIYTLSPGRYCGGLTVQSGATVTLNPGEYIIDDGLLNVQSGATFRGSSVLFYFVGAGARMTIIGGGTVDLKGRAATEANGGMLFIAHPDANRGGSSNFQGGGSFNLEGMLYMPTQRIEVAGNGDINGNSLYFGMVAKDFFFRGNGRFYLVRHDGRSTLPDLMPNMPRQLAQDAYLSK